MIQHQTRPAATVLVVDDDSAIRDAMELLLRSLPAEIVTASDVPAALDVVRHRHVDAIVADYRMPDLSGLDFFALLRQQGSRTPFILVTGHGTIPTAVEAVRAGVAEFLEKPVDPHVMRRAVAQALERAREMPAGSGEGSPFDLDRLEAETIGRALAATGGNRTHAARLLGMHPRTLRKKLNTPKRPRGKP
ncbi:MAG: response regulator [Gemmatimonadota bacterium]|nr:response regulator [Gemmatimonadota bacterium]